MPSGVYVRTIEARKNISLALIGRLPWNKGLTKNDQRVAKNSLEGKLWINAVFERDNYTCQKCGERGKRLNSHHLDSIGIYPEKRVAIDNGVTLCYKDHREFHKKYGFGNNTTDQFEEWRWDSINESNGLFNNNRRQRLSPSHEIQRTSITSFTKKSTQIQSLYLASKSLEDDNSNNGDSQAGTS